MLALNIIGRYHVFAQDGHTRLCKVTIDEGTVASSARPFTESIAVFGQQVRQIAASTSRLVYCIRSPRELLFSIFECEIDFGGFECLELPHRPMSVHNVIRLLGLLPGLVRLNCSLAKSTFGPKSIDLAWQVDEFSLTHYPLSQRLKQWTTDCEAGVSIKHLARSVMLITVLCPRFSFACLSLGIREAFSREVAWTALTTPFMKHAERLKTIV
ncbi:hypothetical protein GGH92_009996, partial [Coemansia sp. RSA 2673]